MNGHVALVYVLVYTKESLKIIKGVNFIFHIDEVHAGKLFENTPWVRERSTVTVSCGQGLITWQLIPAYHKRIPVYMGCTYTAQRERGSIEQDVGRSLISSRPHHNCTCINSHFFLSDCCLCDSCKSGRLVATYTKVE
ncbi:unnamed protein product [Allacma fusca]|uniref:Uncharacterized protein n=1 Tax=Allacma fusca TaxID=39272 RepID=A0A8J2P1A4_9HEXA|nr:unnamed protein product [Allacma fusca]